LKILREFDSFVNYNIITYNTERLFFREILIIFIWGFFLLELFIEVCHNEIFERISFVVFGAAVYRPSFMVDYTAERRKSERKNEKWLFVCFTSPPALQHREIFC
jgi:hypothetical protein